jgi:hypothetical protein
MAKLLAVAFFLWSNLARIPDVYLPFVPWLDHLRSQGHWFQWSLRCLYCGAAVLLLLNQLPRACCVLLGGATWLWVLASRPAYFTNHLCLASFLLLIGLYDRRWGSRLLRYQLALVYLGPGLNKLLDPDWQSGRMFEHYLHLLAVGKTTPFFPSWPAQMLLRLDSILPPLLLARTFSWATIVIELTLAVACVRMMPRLVLWGGVGFHGALTFTSSFTFGVYFPAMLTARLAFFDFENPLQITQGPRTAWLHRLSWTFDRFGLRPKIEWQTGDHLLVRSGHRIYTNLEALKVIALSHPATYFALLVLLAASTGILFHPLAGVPFYPAFVGLERWSIFVMLLLWSPLTNRWGARTP